VLRSLHLPRSLHNPRGSLRGVSDLVSGYGEVWSTRLFRPFFAERARRPGPVAWLDARRVVVVEWGPLGPGVQWPESRANIQAQVPPQFDGTLIITGFVAVDRRGVPTTLGRNGSDFSGSIFGALLDAIEIIIWTDVDGVLSADPRLTSMSSPATDAWPLAQVVKNSGASSNSVSLSTARWTRWRISAASLVRASATAVWNAPCKLWLRTSPRNTAPPGASRPMALSMTSARYPPLGKYWMTELRMMVSK